MRTFIRYIRDHAFLWRLWLPFLVVTVVHTPVLFSMSLVERYLIDDVILAKHLDLMGPAALGYGALWILATLLSSASGLLRTLLSERLGSYLRQRLFVHYTALSLAFSRREHSGRTSALFTSDVPSATGLLSSTIALGIGSLVAVILGPVFMFKLNPHLAAAVIVAPPIVGAVAWIVTRPIRPLSRQAQEKAAELQERLQEALTGIREIVSFGGERHQAARFAHTLTELVDLRIRLAVLDATIQGGQSMVSLVINIVIVVYGGYLVIEGRTTVGTLLAMRLLLGYLFQPAQQLFSLAGGLQRGLASVDRIYAFLDAIPDVREPRDPRSTDQVRGEVTFDGVSFAYGRGPRVLHDISLAASPGQVIALVGPSGAGKSTMASLIARFYDPTVGRILLDGVDLREYSLEMLRRQIAIVSQDTFLFATTIRENIAVGRRDATDAEIVAAAQAANAWEFIEPLADGLDTQVGERGFRLSEGQKQRLAIARALLRDPRILILDEPTSALDARSEYLIQAALDRLVSGRTTLVIAHRLATVRRAACILVVDGGRIVERGTHAELQERPGLYRDLCELQLGPDLPTLPVKAVTETGRSLVLSS